MEKPTLLVLAAGMGSRYGGLKQIDPLGPQGEIIMDYSVYDAILAGFDRVVFVIKEELREAFHQAIGSRFDGKVRVDYAFQRLEDLPGGRQVPEGRVKPWGTGHAVLAARERIHGPFGVINADDFLGRDSILRLGQFCAQECTGAHLAMVGFRLGNTLSESGGVSRGVCETKNGHLVSVTERTGIRTENGTVVCDGGLTLSPEAPVSMNVWALHSDLFPRMETDFARWLDEGGAAGLKTEFYLPTFVDGLVKDGTADVRVLDTDSQWIGVTYQADKPGVQSALAALHRDGVYPPLR